MQANINYVKKQYQVIASVILAAALILLPFGGLNGNAAASKSYLSGITLDVSNRYYSVKEIKKYIRLAAESKKGFLQLHFTGDRNVGIECVTLGQTADKKHVKNKGAYYNPKTGKCFLSKKQVKEILRYAKKKKVQVVPEIDMPGHMGGFQKLYRIKYGKGNDKIFNRDYDGELLIRNKKAVSFAKEIYGEYAKLFRGCRYFHIGCDEFWSGTASENAKYINTISRCLERKGFIVWAWNDLFTKKNCRTIHHSIWVTYWSYDGDTQSRSERKARRKTRASFPELQREGFAVLNYNSYYLYYTPSVRNTNKADADYAVSDAKKNWNVKRWDSNKTAKSGTVKNIRGASVSVWGEDSKGVKAKAIYDQIDGLYRVMYRKMNGH